MSEFWKDYTSQELEELVKENPLTKERVNCVLQNKIKKISIIDYIGADASISPYFNGGFSIGLSNKLSQEERCEGLIHEICHAYYEIRGFDILGRGSWLEQEEGKKMEEIIEKEAQRFYRENKEFIDSIANKIIA